MTFKTHNYELSLKYSLIFLKKTNLNNDIIKNIKIQLQMRIFCNVEETLETVRG